MDRRRRIPPRVGRSRVEDLNSLTRATIEERTEKDDMLDHEMNAYLCDVERGKPMHALLKVGA
jgi:hypothetical protein